MSRERPEVGDRWILHVVEPTAAVVVEVIRDPRYPDDGTDYLVALEPGGSGTSRAWYGLDKLWKIGAYVGSATATRPASPDITK